MTDSMANIHYWQFVLLVGAGIVIGFFAFLILFKERLAALRDLEEREVLMENEIEARALARYREVLAERKEQVRRALMDGKI